MCRGIECLTMFVVRVVVAASVVAVVVGDVVVVVHNWTRSF